VFFLAFLHTLTVRWATEEQPACEICQFITVHSLVEQVETENQGGDWQTQFHLKNSRKMAR